MLGVSADNAQGVGVAHATLPALDDNDGVAGGEGVELESVLDSPLDAAVDVLLPVDLVEVGLGLGEVEGVDTTVQVAESRGGGVAGDHEDGADGAVLGEETSRLARGGQDDDTTGTEIEGGADSGHGARLDSADRAAGEGGHLLEVRDVGNRVLGLQTGLVHLSDSLARVRALGSLARQHNAVGTVSDGVSNVTDLGTSGTRVLDHGLEHLGSTDDRLAGQVAHGNKLLLGSEDLGGRDLNTEITTGNHDTVRLSKNLGEVVETLAVLNLGDDLNVLALLTKDLADVLDVLGTADEGGKNHVNIVLDTKLKVGLVLLGESGQIDIGVRQVDTLLGGDIAVVSSAALDVLVVGDLQHVEGEDAVVDVDDATGLDDLCDVLVVNVPVLSALVAQAGVKIAYMLSVSQAVMYFSSVVMLMILPASMGRSASPAVLPVRISGPLVSRAMAQGLPSWASTAARALSMTLWWYS